MLNNKVFYLIICWWVNMSKDRVINSNIGISSSRKFETRGIPKEVWFLHFCGIWDSCMVEVDRQGVTHFSSGERLFMAIGNERLIPCLGNTIFQLSLCTSTIKVLNSITAKSKCLYDCIWSLELLNHHQLSWYKFQDIIAIKRSVECAVIGK